MTLKCWLCEEEIEEGERVLAFDEIVIFDDYWNARDDDDDHEFDEIEPLSGSWKLAHYFCMFQKSE